MPEIYRDGVNVRRCITCGSALRDAAERPLVLVQQTDIEELICLLVEYLDCPEVWADTIKRLEQACGLTHRQINARHRAENIVRGDNTEGSQP